MSELTDELRARIAAVLTAAEFVSEGATQSWDSSVVHGGEKDNAPRSQGLSLLDEAVTAFSGLTARFEKKVERAKRAPERPPEDERVKKWRKHLIDKYEGVHEEDVSEAEKVSVSYVRQIRKEAGCRPVNGKRLSI